MEVKFIKTKVLHVRPQDPVTETTSSEASKVSKFVWPHINCGFRFLTTIVNAAWSYMLVDVNGTTSSK